jgi:hypothetical protein
MHLSSKLTHMGILGLLVATLVTAASLPGLAREKNETIDATIYGTSTDPGKNVGVTLIIYRWSTPEDRQVLVDAFQKGQMRN